MVIDNITLDQVREEEQFSGRADAWQWGTWSFSYWC